MQTLYSKWVLSFKIFVMKTITEFTDQGESSQDDLRLDKFIIQSHPQFASWIIQRGINAGQVVHCKRLYYDFMDDNLLFQSGEVNKISHPKFRRWVDYYGLYAFDNVPSFEKGLQGMVYIFNERQEESDDKLFKMFVAQYKKDQEKAISDKLDSKLKDKSLAKETSLVFTEWMDEKACLIAGKKYLGVTLYNSFISDNGIAPYRASKIKFYKWIDTYGMYKFGKLPFTRKVAEGKEITFLLNI